MTVQHGSITERIVLDGQGHFSARGRHVREHPDRSVKARTKRTARDLPRLGGWGHDELDRDPVQFKRDCWTFNLNPWTQWVASDDAANLNGTGPPDSRQA